jgi:hypothetical protein
LGYGAWEIYAEESTSSSRLFFQNSAGNGGYLASNVNVTNIDFTGQHRSIIDLDLTDRNLADLEGMIVKSTGVYKNLNDTATPSINEALPIVMLTNTEKDKAVYGVISGFEDLSQGNRTYETGAFITTISVKDENGNIVEEDRVIINSVGEGAMWVSNYGDYTFENGDYITSSPIEGLGMLQVKDGVADDTLRNYTVAKITQDCNFTDENVIEFTTPDGNTYLKQLVGVTYHCG